jgi:hypothetical protein
MGGVTTNFSIMRYGRERYFMSQIFPDPIRNLTEADQYSKK